MSDVEGTATETPADAGTNAEAQAPRPITVKRFSHLLQQERYDHKNMKMFIDIPEGLSGRVEIVGVAVDKLNGQVLCKAGQAIPESEIIREGGEA